MKKIVLSILLLVLIFQVAKSQTIAREVVASCGTFAQSGIWIMEWTIGEVTIETYTSEKNFFTQGFHQPDVLIKETITDFFIPEGFSPNEDFINDLFVIRGLEKYPMNSIVIFNRWGNKVFEANPYKNDWDGKAAFGLRIGEDELPNSTYFYVFDLGNGSSKIKGTIYLNR